MWTRILFRTSVALVLAVFALSVPACTSTPKAEPEMLTGDQEMAHERHATGLGSHVNY